MFNHPLHFWSGSHELTDVQFWMDRCIEHLPTFYRVPVSLDYLPSEPVMAGGFRLVEWDRAEQKWRYWAISMALNQRGSQLHNAS